MTLKEVSQLTGIPYQTLLGWNSSKGDYRKNLVRFLKESDRSALIKYFSPKKIEKLKKESH
jgi:hypothetical protein